MVGSITLPAFLWSPPYLCLPFQGALHISACYLLSLLISACLYNLSIISPEMQIPLISSCAPAHKLNMIAYFSMIWIGQDPSSYPLNIIACFYSKFWTKHGACSYPLNMNAYFYSKLKLLIIHLFTQNQRVKSIQPINSPGCIT
jgi:hypothetical protein